MIWLVLRWHEFGGYSGAVGVKARHGRCSWGTADVMEKRIEIDYGQPGRR